MQKDKAIFFGVLGGVLLLLIVYIIFGFGNHNKKDSAKDFEAPQLEMVKQAYNSRIDALTKNKYDDQKQVNPLKYNFLEDSTEKLKNPDKDQGKLSRENSSSKSKKDRLEKNVASKNISTKNTTSQPSKIFSENQDKNIDNPLQKEDIKQEKSSSGGFGIYSNTSKKSTPTNTQKNNKSFFKAYLEEDTRVTNNKSMIFILSEDATLDGQIFKKNSILYGKAVDKGDFFDIEIDNILSTDGIAFSQKQLFVYNEFYDRGIDHEGNLNKAVKDGTSETFYDESRNITGTNAERGVDIAVKAVDNTVKSLRKQKETSVDLYQGYSVYIKKIN